VCNYDVCAICAILYVICSRYVCDMFTTSNRIHYHILVVTISYTHPNKVDVRDRSLLFA
jgi:hypothetical protein